MTNWYKYYWKELLISIILCMIISGTIFQMVTASLNIKQMQDNSKEIRTKLANLDIELMRLESKIEQHSKPSRIIDLAKQRLGMVETDFNDYVFIGNLTVLDEKD